jgi:hypothetical protein
LRRGFARFAIEHERRFLARLDLDRRQHRDARSARASTLASDTSVPATTFSISDGGIRHRRERDRTATPWASPCSA